MRRPGVATCPKMYVMAPSLEEGKTDIILILRPKKYSNLCEENLK